MRSGTKNSLSKNTAFNVAYKLISLVFPLISTAYVSRIMLTDGVGKVSYAQNIASYFVMLATLGLPTYGIKAITRVRENQQELNITFSELCILNCIFSTVASVAYIICITNIKVFSNDLILYVFCGIEVFFNFLNIDWLYSGKEEYVYIVCRNLIIKILSLVAIIVLIKTREDYIYYALITSFALVGNYIFNAVHARKYVSFTIKGVLPKRHLKPIIVMAALIILGSIYNRIDVTMLGSIVSDESVGLYSNAHRLLNIVLSTCAAFTSAFLPRLCFYYENRRSEINGLLNKGVSALSFIAIPSAFGLFYIAPQITSLLFGNDFIPAAKTIRVFALVIIIRAFGDLFCYQLLVASGKEVKRIPANFAAMILNIIMNAIFIPIWHENGAAFASVISELFVNGYLYIFIKRDIKFHISYKPFLQCIFASIIMYIGMIPSYLFNMSDLLTCAFCIPFCGLLYFTALLLEKNDFVIGIKKKLLVFLKHKKI